MLLLPFQLISLLVFFVFFYNDFSKVLVNYRKKSDFDLMTKKIEKVLHASSEIVLAIANMI